jgi:hypothetical protein
MRRLFLVAAAAAALGACGSKGDVAENGSLVENLSFDTSPANDASALEAVEAEGARLAADEAANEVEADNSAQSNTVIKKTVTKTGGNRSSAPANSNSSAAADESPGAEGNSE